MLLRNARRKQVRRVQALFRKAGKVKRNRLFPFQMLLATEKVVREKDLMLLRGCKVDSMDGERMKPSFLQYPGHPNIRRFSSMVLTRIP